MKNTSKKRFLCLFLSVVMLFSILPLGSFAIEDDKSKAKSEKLTLDSILGYDWFGVDNYCHIEIEETEAGNALGFTLLNVPGYFSDRDIRFENDPDATTDWSGATDLLIDLDASSIKSAVRVRIAFEEDTVGKESYQLNEGAAVYLITEEGENTVYASGCYVTLPVGFKGKIRLPLNADTFHRYWDDWGNGQIDLGKVVQFQLSIAGDDKYVGNTFTMDNFSIKGDFGTKVVWDLENLRKRDGYATLEEGSTDPLVSYIQNMDLGGYVGENLINNVRKWQLDAYKNNRGIVEQIAVANAKTFALDNLLGTDYFGVDGYHSIDIVEANGNKSLGWTLKHVPGGYSDRDIKFANDPAAITDWTGATDLLIDLDATAIPTATRVRVAFEENTVGRESYQLSEGATVYLITEAGETQTYVVGGGYVELPVGFKGKLRLPLSGNTFHRYWDDWGNGVLETGKVVQFQMSVAGDEGFVGKTFTMDNFTVLGSFGSKVIWDLENVMKRGSGGDVGNGNIQKWYGEFVGKLLTGMAYSYKATAEKDLVTAANEIIADLSKAQGEDGYLGVFIGNARYSLAFDNWDLWNQYHCISGLLEWYKLTENETALKVAKKALDCIYNTFKDRSYIVTGGFETNRGIAHGYAQMYQITGEVKYLNEAIRIIEDDCKHNGNGWYPYAIAGKDFVNSNNRRWEILHMVMTLGILYEETGNKEYYEVMGTVWESVMKTDIHNAGTFTTNEGAHGNPYDDGVVETCCTIAWAAFTNEYYKYNQSVRLADELERTYLNGILASLLDDDKYCTYNTPMNGFAGAANGYDGRKVSSQQDIAFQFNTASPDMNCCQANYARGIGQISEWALLTSKDALYLNYYGESSITTLIDGKEITLTQTTEYPLNGAVKVKISGLEEETEFTLKLRIPTWAYGSKVSYDGKSTVAKNGEYFTITKTWKNGDCVYLDLALSFTYLSGEQGQNGKTSVFYGPILFALDSYYAPNFDRNTAISLDAIESATIKTDAKTDTFLVADINVNGTALRLIDFASAGKYNGTDTPATYYTWLNVEGSPAPKAGVTWQNTDKYKIAFDDAIEYESALAYEGETITFRVNELPGMEFTGVASEDVEITEENGVYSFVMPAKNVSVSAEFTELTSASDLQFKGYQMGLDGSSIRLIGSVSDLSYESVSLEVTVTGDENKSFGIATTKVFKVLCGMVNGERKPVAATASSGITDESVIIFKDADYLFGYAITGIPAGDYTFTIVPTAITASGDTVVGKTTIINVTIG